MKKTTESNTEAAQKKTRKSNKVDAKAFANAVASGSKIGDAMIAAGYSPTTARKGRRCLSPECKKELEITLKKTFVDGVKISKTVNDEQLRHAVRGGIIRNISERCDKGVNSLKLAGSMKELNMFSPETVSGVVIINVPQTLPSFAGIPKLDDQGRIIGTLDAQGEMSERSRFFSIAPEDVAWRNGPEGQEVRKQLQEAGQL